MWGTDWCVTHEISSTCARVARACRNLKRLVIAEHVVGLLERLAVVSVHLPRIAVPHVSLSNLIVRARVFVCVHVWVRV
jgi:hypothetical protein